MSSQVAQPPKFSTFRLKDFVPTWIGGNPFGDGFVLGSRDGVVAFADEKGHETVDRHELSISKSAINGIDGQDRYLAVSTPEEISVFGFPENDGEKVRSSKISHGAHSVVAASNGQFLAPLGQNGIGIITPDYHQGIEYRVITFKHEPIFYRIAELPPSRRRNYFACACRTYGIGIIDWEEPDEDPVFQVGTFSGADVIDVVAIPTGDYPHAMAAVGTDGELFLCRDAVHHEPPVTLHYKQLSGTVYRILAARGHLILLTGKAFYVLADLAKRIVQSVFDESDSSIMTVPIEAVDAYVHENRWLMIITSEGVRNYDLSLIDSKLKAFASLSNKSTRRQSRFVGRAKQHRQTLSFKLGNQKLLHRSEIFNLGLRSKATKPRTEAAVSRLDRPVATSPQLIPYRHVLNCNR